MTAPDTETNSVTHMDSRVVPHAQMGWVEDTLFWIGIGMLVQLSQPFKDMLDILQGTRKDDAIQGQSDQNLIVLEQVSAVDFEYLCKFLFGPWTSPPYDLAYPIAVWRLSQRWEITSLHLRIARAFDMKDWICSGVAELLESYDAFMLLMRAHEDLHGLRKEFGFIPPDIEYLRSSTCKEHVNCARIWKNEWIVHIGRKLKLSSIPDEVKAMELTGMAEECKAIIVDAVAGMEGYGKEDALIKYTISSLNSLKFDIHELFSVSHDLYVNSD
ncbi:uncharacterized protein LAESUDRAFT_714142 [Laetiporus sulphureus 93-53]|uniref:BTB domain-containing protein n=1 Tax=Laetiporus sulphureus 93-53 TaxID=1314785 RepID=A0A165EC01_9APHY|nr:uncharacterized protein LAESUDRAFT_714142 [Laetiporus sulphureus 93-53]KZT06696.1 hypothetical protein LAESUDRAFT_714142 [Laetiporus sulphureus 93-53]